jgi:putative oxidoreductase
MDRWSSVGIALMRVMVGVVFVAHGGMKLFVFGIGGTAGFMTSQGIPLPLVSAVLVIATELLGGLALVAGFGTRFIAWPLAFAMFVAVTMVHLGGGFFAPAGFEYPLTLLVASISLGLTGSGALAIDSLLFKRDPSTATPALSGTPSFHRAA